MGLFSALRNVAPAQNTAAEDAARTVLTLPLLVACADGKIDPSELDQILNMCAFSPIFHAVGAERTTALAKEILKERAEKGAEPCFARAAKTMTPKLAETALCFAVRTSMADGNVSKEELDMLLAMADRMTVPVETTKKIFDVMTMMQRRAA
jgi:tellurite resistance protein